MERLETATELFIECQYRRMSCEKECPLNQPIHEHSEHPTFCELLTVVNENFNVKEA